MYRNILPVLFILCALSVDAEPLYAGNCTPLDRCRL
jgi:hypothetical protein